VEIVATPAPLTQRADSLALGRPAFVNMPTAAKSSPENAATESQRTRLAAYDVRLRSGATSSTVFRRSLRCEQHFPEADWAGFDRRALAELLCTLSTPRSGPSDRPNARWSTGFTL